MQCPITGMAGTCPVGKGKEEKEAEEVRIHRITEDSPEDGLKPTQLEIAEGDVDIEAIDENPNLSEYRKLKRVMATITQFYERGSEAKMAQRDAMQEQLDKLLVDRAMMVDQQEALAQKPFFRKHPRSGTYQGMLVKELNNIDRTKAEFEEKLKEFSGLYEWSKTIVLVCRWLEDNLQFYCHSKGLTVDGLEPGQVPEEPPALDAKQMFDYSRGLAEITFNLQESQDFFQASVDGRLRRYHEIERDIILAQLKALQSYAEENDRRCYWEAELLDDLKFVEDLLVETPASQKRRHKMLANHVEFFQVLKYHRDRLGALCPEAMDQVQYDPKYTWVSELNE